MTPSEKRYGTNAPFGAVDVILHPTTDDTQALKDILTDEKRDIVSIPVGDVAALEVKEVKRYVGTRVPHGYGEVIADADPEKWYCGNCEGTADALCVQHSDFLVPIGSRRSPPPTTPRLQATATTVEAPPTPEETNEPDDDDYVSWLVETGFDRARGDEVWHAPYFAFRRRGFPT